MNLNEQIDFEVACILTEFKTKFNFQEFKKFEDVEKMVQYAKNHLKVLGEGSSRIAFLLSNRFVLKIARPEDATSLKRGLAQNEAEVEVFTNPKTKPVVAAIYTFDPNYKWVVSELVRPFKSRKEAEDRFGFFWNYIDMITDHGNKFYKYIQEKIEKSKQLIEIYEEKVKNANGEDEESVKYYTNLINREVNNIKTNEKIIKHPITEAVIHLIEELGLMPGDVNEWEHWGKTANDRIVILDYGFTENTVGLYFDKSSNVESDEKTNKPTAKTRVV